MRRYLIGAVAVGTLAALAGCSSDQITSFSSATLLPRADQFARPDWLTYSGGKEDFTLRPVGPEDLISQDGQCAPATAEQVAVASAAAARNNPDFGAGAPRDGGPAPIDDAMPLMQGGIALQMTECDVVRRAGAPERLEFGGGGGERMVTITYIRGSRPGIYRFSSGRLYSIERAPEAAPAPKAKAKPAKKRA